MLDYSTKSFILSNRERYCLLIDKVSGNFLFYPNLFITSQVRPKSSYSTMLSKLGCIKVFLHFLDEKKINIEERIYKKTFFEINELDAIRDFCQRNFRETSEILQRYFRDTSEILQRYFRDTSEILSLKK